MACTRRTVGDTHLSLSGGLVARHQGHQLTPHVHQLLRRREAHLWVGDEHMPVRVRTRSCVLVRARRATPHLQVLALQARQVVVLWCDTTHQMPRHNP